MINDKDRDYIDHEVRLRVMKELNDERHGINKEKFFSMDKKIDKTFLSLNRKLNLIITTCGAIFATVLAPIFLHAMKLV